ncbi:hypothetical protein ACFPRL_21300 [Pseudoclavibacter helvolus]
MLSDDAEVVLHLHVAAAGASVCIHTSLDGDVGDDGDFHAFRAFDLGDEARAHLARPHDADADGAAKLCFALDEALRVVHVRSFCASFVGRTSC